MSDTTANHEAGIPVENVLREELAHGDAVLGTTAPILGHLVLSSANSLFSDEIVAQVRGMAASIASQLLSAQAKAAKAESLDAYIEQRRDPLVEALLSKNEFLFHLHALTVERQLAARLESRNAIDLVLSPLLQALVSSDDANTSSTAMSVLAAQSRFIQHQRRMELPLNELPGDLFHAAIQHWRALDSGENEEIAGQVEEQLRSAFNEGDGRAGLLARLVSGMGSGSRAALSISHAGVAIFLTAVALSTGQSRDLVAMSTSDRQLGRLALALRAAGLKPGEVEEQFVHIHPEVSLPDGFDMLRVDRAAQLLASSNGFGAA